MVCHKHVSSRPPLISSSLIDVLHEVGYLCLDHGCQSIVLIIIHEASRLLRSNTGLEHAEGCEGFWLLFVLALGTAADLVRGHDPSIERQEEHCEECCGGSA